ncbi:MAG: LysM peptidoglycan-binding domain-containing protein, partial [Treponema sp.]|nr:LysM peptidoglycan-binding domain-containing protein [Treponema sp.]
MTELKWQCRVFLRLAMAAACVSAFLTVFPLPRVNVRLRSTETEVENGMGGMGYPPEKAGEEDGFNAGIPEPESFSRPRMLFSSSYTVKDGDMVGLIAPVYGLNDDTIMSVNGIKNARELSIGRVLKIPNQDGILYTVKEGDDLENIAEKYSIEKTDLETVNEIFSEKIHRGTVLFIPGARLDWVQRQEINGDLFIWPVQ